MAYKGLPPDRMIDTFRPEEKRKQLFKLKEENQGISQGQVLNSVDEDLQEKSLNTTIDTTSNDDTSETENSNKKSLNESKQSNVKWEAVENKNLNTRDFMSILEHGKWKNDAGNSHADIIQFHDLINKMLDYDPMKRITPSDALLHPFITQEYAGSMRRKVQEEELEKSSRLRSANTNTNTNHSINNTISINNHRSIGSSSSALHGTQINTVNSNNNQSIITTSNVESNIYEMMSNAQQMELKNVLTNLGIPREHLNNLHHKTSWSIIEKLLIQFTKINSKEIISSIELKFNEFKSERLRTRQTMQFQSLIELLKSFITSNEQTSTSASTSTSTTTNTNNDKKTSNNNTSSTLSSSIKNQSEGGNSLLHDQLNLNQDDNMSDDSSITPIP